MFDWAKAAGHCEGDNPVAQVTLGFPKQPDRSTHHASMPFADVPGFVGKLRSIDMGVPTKLAFEFLILSAARTGVILNATWSEIDIDEGIWTIPAERLKSGRDHRVPLSDRCLAILEEANTLSVGADFIFPGNKPRRPLSNMVFLMVLRRQKFKYTAHGFRSSFRDWASETTSFSREVCEMALAHSLKDKTEAAYQRGDLLEKRRELMNAWAIYLCFAGENVVTLSISRRQ